MKLIQVDILEVPIKIGCKFSIESDTAYQMFREYFEIVGGRDVFSINEFAVL
jgi:hypothetical protein